MSLDNIIFLLFWLSPGTTFAAALIAAMSTMLPSEIDSLDDMAKEELSQLSDVENLMVGTNVNQVEVRLPYLEYQYPDSSKNWRFVDGRGIITRMHTSAGWIKYIKQKVEFVY